MATTDVNGLLLISKCYVCTTPGQMLLLELGLLKQIAESEVLSRFVGYPGDPLELVGGGNLELIGGGDMQLTNP